MTDDYQHGYEAARSYYSRREYQLDQIARTWASDKAHHAQSRDILARVWPELHDALNALKENHNDLP